MPHVKLPPYRTEVPYVLKAHRELPVEERPVFWYRKLTLEDLGNLMDSSSLTVHHKGSDEIEERRYVGKVIMQVLRKYLLRVERLYLEDDKAFEMPPPNDNGGLSAERKAAIERLPRDWQVELVNAITEDRAAEDEALAKN